MSSKKEDYKLRTIKERFKSFTAPILNQLIQNELQKKYSNHATTTALPQLER